MIAIINQRTLQEVNRHITKAFDLCDLSFQLRRTICAVDSSKFKLVSCGLFFLIMVVMMFVFTTFTFVIVMVMVMVMMLVFFMFMITTVTVFLMFVLMFMMVMGMTLAG